jgi:trans-aconitate methyltransferase
MAVNSREWWDHYFIEQWEANRGREQTRYFTSRLCECLAAREWHWIASAPRTILDWGCALGDGIDQLHHCFPDCDATGLDFSRTAITKAVRDYPRHKFVLAEDAAPLPPFDVVLTSNCLEHFAEPLAVMSTHLAHCRFLYLLLVPFREQHLHESHVTRFDLDSFPDQLDGFTKLGAAIFRCEPRYWNGEQILVSYASPEYLAAGIG